jgi:TRAP-type C4-dicarboxylate transport system substrate-binding protein
VAAIGCSLKTLKEHLMPVSRRDLLGFAAGFTPLLAARAAANWRLATAYPEDTHHTVNLQWFSEKVAQSGPGAPLLEIHPNGKLVKPAEIFEAVRSGRVEAGEVIMSSQEKENPVFGIDSVPFLARNMEEARQLWTLSRDAVAQALQAKGLQLLYAVPWPAQNLYTARPIEKLANMKGMKMRAYNPATQKIAELVGAEPTQIQVVDLPKAIEENRVEAMITSSWTGVQVQAWTRLANYYEVNAWIPKNMVFANKKVFDGLPLAVRRAMLARASDAETRGWAMSRSFASQYDAQLARQKVKVQEPSVYLQGELRRMGERLTREWVRGAGQESLAILLKFEQTRTAVAAR